MRDKKFFLGAAARIAVVIAIVVTVVFEYEPLVNLDVRTLVAAVGSLWTGAALVLGVYALKAVLFVIPASMIYISAGLAFDFVPGMLLNTGGLLIELTLTYFLGRFLGGEVVRRKLSGVKYGEKILALEEEKAGGLFLVRVLPVFPIDFVSLFLGATKMPFLRYLLISLGGILPRVLLFTLLGDSFYEIFPKKLLMLTVIVLITGAAVFATVRYFLKHKKEKQKP